MITKRYISNIGSKIKKGTLKVKFPNDQEILFKGEKGLNAELILKSYKPIFRTIFGGISVLLRVILNMNGIVKFRGAS